jgi:hypothetical protein
VEYTGGDLSEGWIEEELTFYRNGDTLSIWNFYNPQAPNSPYVSGETYTHFDGSGYSSYTIYGEDEETHCYTEWDEEGAGYRECDDGTYEEF